jgi:hypothetical protein
VYSDFGGGPTDAGPILASQRVWLVEGHGGFVKPEVRAALDSFESVEMRDYGNGVRVQLLEHR